MRRAIRADLPSLRRSLVVISSVIAVLLNGHAHALPPVGALAHNLGPAVVWLESESPRADRPRSVGFFVGTRGILAAVLPGATVGEGVRVRRHAAVDPGGAALSGVVRAVGEHGLVLVEVPPLLDSVGYPALGLVDDKRARVPSTRSWLTGLCHHGDEVVGSIGGFDDLDGHGGWHLSLPCAPGAPVLLEDEVVAIVVQNRGGGIALALPAAEIRALARTLTQAPAPR